MCQERKDQSDARLSVRRQLSNGTKYRIASDLNNCISLSKIDEKCARPQSYELLVNEKFNIFIFIEVPFCI